MICLNYFCLRSAEHLRSGRHFFNLASVFNTHATRYVGHFEAVNETLVDCVGKEINALATVILSAARTPCDSRCRRYIFFNSFSTTPPI